MLGSGLAKFSPKLIYPSKSYISACRTTSLFTTDVNSSPRAVSCLLTFRTHPRSRSYSTRKTQVPALQGKPDSQASSVSSKAGNSLPSKLQKDNANLPATFRKSITDSDLKHSDLLNAITRYHTTILPPSIRARKVPPPTSDARAFPRNQFKTKVPRTPGKRHLKRVPRDHLWKGRPVRALTIARRNQGGRNRSGQITTRHRGGGHKRRIRIIDWYRWEPGPQQVVRLEHDPARSAWIALLRNTHSERFSYIIAPHSVKPGDILHSYRLQEETVVQDDGITKVTDIGVGNCLPISMIPVGSMIHNIGLMKGGPAKMARTAGNFAQLLQTGKTGYAQIKLSSGEVRLVPVEACATIGVVSNPDHQHEKLGKAGRRRWMGWRPTVRGVAMNATDHPHGGGRGKSKGNKHPRSPWGVPAKGGKTRNPRKLSNKLIAKARPRR